MLKIVWLHLPYSLWCYFIADYHFGTVDDTLVQQKIKEKKRKRRCNKFIFHNNNQFNNWNDCLFITYIYIYDLERYSVPAQSIARWSELSPPTCTTEVPHPDSWTHLLPDRHRPESGIPPPTLQPSNKQSIRCWLEGHPSRGKEEISVSRWLIFFIEKMGALDFLHNLHLHGPSTSSPVLSSRLCFSLVRYGGPFLFSL